MEYLPAVISQLGPIIIGILGTIVLFMLRGLTKKFGDKLSSDNKMNLDQLYVSLITQGISLAEQWAKNQKNKGITTSGEQKLYAAMEFIAGQIERYGLDKLAEEELKDRIESILGFSFMEQPAIELPGINPLEENDENDW